MISASFIKLGPVERLGGLNWPPLGAAWGLSDGSLGESVRAWFREHRRPALVHALIRTYYTPSLVACVNRMALAGGVITAKDMSDPDTEYTLRLIF